MTATTDDGEAEETGAGHPRNFYGRRFGKALRTGQKARLATLADLAPPGVAREENPARTPVDLPALFGGTCPVWLEVGFGAGEHMLAQAAANPGVGLIGCEPFINGVAAFLARLEAAGLTNIRIHAGDARDLLEVLPEGSISRAFLLYPDPWPKRRHHRRRFVNRAEMDALARTLAPGARFHLATDVPDYVRQALEVLGDHPAFTRAPHDIATPWEDWHRTRYEAKALRERRVPGYLTFVRR